MNNLLTLFWLFLKVNLLSTSGIASVGLLHVRPVVNLKSADGVAKFARIAEQIADLVLEFGGALSGEHGDGLVRAPFQEKMFGPALYQAFREVKRTFDPENLFRMNLNIAPAMHGSATLAQRPSPVS